MKRVFLITILSLGMFFGFSNVTYADTNSDDFNLTDSVNIEQVNSEDIEGTVISFDELSEQEKEYFKDKGFDESNQYFTSEAYLPPSPGDLTRAINVVRITGSTKKQTNTLAYTEYVISATSAGFLDLDLDCRLNMGNVKTVYSAVTPYGAPLVYGGGIFSSYTGKSVYMTYKLTIQYTTYYGTGGLGSQTVNVGGVTLGV